QDLVRTPQLGVLFLQLADLGELLRGLARLGVTVDLRLPEPLAQRLRRTNTELAGDRADRLELTRIPALGHRLDDSPDRALTKLPRILTGTCHDSILQSMEPPDIPGRFTAAGGQGLGVVLVGRCWCCLVG